MVVVCAQTTFGLRLALCKLINFWKSPLRGLYVSGLHSCMFYVSL